jgi:hypothetical protein
LGRGGDVVGHASCGGCIGRGGGHGGGGGGLGGGGLGGGGLGRGGGAGDVVGHVPCGGCIGRGGGLGRGGGPPGVVLPVELRVALFAARYECCARLA